MRAWIYLLVLLVAAAPVAGQTIPWPDAGGGGSGGGGTASYIVLTERDTATVAATTTWQHIASTTYETEVASADSCFSSPANGVVQFDCADGTLVRLTGGAIARPDPIGTPPSAGSQVWLRIGEDNAGTCNSFASVGGYGNEARKQSLTPVDGAIFPFSVIDHIVVADQGDCWRLESRLQTGTGSVVFQSLALLVQTIGGSAGQDGADADFATGGASNTATLSGAAPIVTKTANATLTDLEMSGGVITNNGSGATITLTLGSGSCSAGRHFTVLHADAQAIVLEPNGTDFISNLTDANGDSVTSDGLVTSAASCACITSGEWVCTKSGTWSDTN